MKRLSVNVRLSVRDGKKYCPMTDNYEKKLNYWTECEESNYIPKEHHKTNVTYHDKDLINLHTLLVTENLDKH